MTRTWIRGREKWMWKEQIIPLEQVVGGGSRDQGWDGDEGQ